ncbi:MAG TPA: HAMP domain-containing sensor histidine kinase [Vicinamibacterales bacterium]|jgi:signal transduction histidine kinase|nr:HAMP domain-containing sensor histidine kinase [Vicinamibacterales bacterium]
MISGRRRSVIFFTVLGTCLVAIAVALNVGWLVINWTRGVLALLGLIFFLVIIAGMVLNTIFLVREIRRNEQHDSFINAVTHELKTPVASIRLYLQTLQSRDLDESKRQEFYRIMLDDSDRLLHTIEQVLRAGSTQSPFRRIAQTRVDLGELAADCVALARTRFHLNEEAMRFEPRISAPAIVLGDADELKAAVWNLIDNAVKYSTSHPQVSVTLEETADRSRYALKVADRGPGISPNELKRVFRRFYRIHGMSVRAKGSGLGLFIVRSVARRHGGKAFAESEGAGRGSTFTILLPRPAEPA